MKESTWSARQILVISSLLNDSLDHLLCKRGHLHDWPYEVESCDLAYSGLSREELRKRWEEIDKMIDEYRNNLY